MVDTMCEALNYIAPTIVVLAVDLQCERVMKFAKIRKC